VAIARALAQNPKFLIMDEPTGNVDSKNRDIIMGLIQKLNAELGITVIIVTHDLEIAKRTRRTIKLLDGLVESDSENEIIMPEIDFAAINGNGEEEKPQ
jgi:ABC-type lipoprotein export system ATPase subunit